jgi:HD-GYP domain-containing protein (c-di-GMP phosphodiesterase class II)
VDDNSPTRFTLLCIGVAATAAALAVALAVAGDRPEWVPVVVFGALGILAANRNVVLPGNETSFGASFMLPVAALVVFRFEGSILGALLVGMACGVMFHQMHGWNPARWEWRKLLFNIGNFGLSTFCAALVLWAVPLESLQRTPVLLLAAIPATAVCVLVNDALLALAVSLMRDVKAATLLREWRFNQLTSVPYAIFAAFVGRLYLEIGPIIVPLFLVTILVARETFASYLAMKRSHDDTVRILIGALEAKDQYTAGHAERVAMFANYIGLELGLSAKRLERLRLAALMHDVGKLVVPNHLLNKPGKLTEAEFSQVRLHETVSVEILTRIDFLAPVAPSAQSEFTRFTPVADDKGQPIEPHIVAVADAFDAMTSTRSYRKALSQQTAFKELRENAGKQFHPRVVDALITAIERRSEVYGEGHEVDVHDFAVEPPTAGLGSAGLGDLLEEDAADSPGVSNS